MTKRRPDKGRDRRGRSAHVLVGARVATDSGLPGSPCARIDRNLDRRLSRPGEIPCSCAWPVRHAIAVSHPNRPISRRLALLIRSALARLQQLDPLGGDLSWEEWVELFRRVLDETSIPIEEERHQGVQVLDAMTARGRTVRALFVLGMNEKLFPRYVREDPFLRDRQRVVLESTLGYKIDEKLAGHEEEVLLFELLSRSATNRLYLSYQRADEAGRVMAPSGFIAMAMRDPRFVGKPEEPVPRRLTQRISEQPSIQDLLPAEELALGCLLQGHDAGLISLMLFLTLLVC